MLRYRGYDWALVHGESRIEVHLWSSGGGKRSPVWRLALQYIAVGPEWRRCDNLDRPHFFLELMGFHVPLGDWRNLSEVDFWNTEEPVDFFESDDYRSPGDLRFEFLSSYRNNREEERANLPYFNWRVVSADGALITIELSADSDPEEAAAETLETVSAIPGQAAGPESAVAHGIYLLETLPFGIVTTAIPRNAPDPCAHAELLARRQLKTSTADHMKLSDYKDSKHERMRADLHVELHYFGYHGT